MRSTQYIYWAYQLTLSEKGEIEELVRLSYQALERNLEERSKTVIKERGWGESFDVMNRRVPRMRPNEARAAPQYPPPRPESRGQHMPPYDGDFRDRPHTEYEETSPNEYTAAGAPHQFPEPPVMPPRPTIHFKRQEQDATKPTRPEVRFTFPREQLVSDFADTTKETPSSPAKPDTPSTKTDNQLQVVRQKLEGLRKRKEEAEKARDISTAADLTYYVIPDLEADLEELLEHERLDKLLEEGAFGEATEAGA